jgi:NADH-quinone oxidoreductase subunit N
VNGVSINWAVASPFVIVVLTALAAMMTDVFVRSRAVTAFLSLGGLVVALAGAVWLWVSPQPDTFGSARMPAMLTADPFALVAVIIVLATAILCFVMSNDWLRQQGLWHAEFHILTLFAVAGMILMVQAKELITIFIALETFSVSLYVLSAFARRRERSAEAGLKYLLLGAFASGFMLYGIALLYGATGKTHLDDIAAALHGGAAAGILPSIGVGLLIVGLGFKVSAVPFHVWTPDVYEGAPTPITAFMSVGTKVAAFVAMARILNGAVADLAGVWAPIVAAVAVATMVLGNTAALMQTDVKRLLAYSSIAHAGYILLGILAGSASAVIFYLTAYAAMNLGAFAVVMYMARQGAEYTRTEDLKGLARRSPLVAGALAVFMFSLAGIPPLVGFFGKFEVFRTAVNAGYTGLVIVAVLASVASAYYYLRLLIYAFMHEPEEHVNPAPLSAGVGATLLVTVAVTLLCGLWPDTVMKYTDRAEVTTPAALMVHPPAP